MELEAVLKVARELSSVLQTATDEQTCLQERKRLLSFVVVGGGQQAWRWQLSCMTCYERRWVSTIPTYARMLK